MSPMSNYSIQNLPETERPRERLMRYGPESLTNAELIAILLGSGMKGISVLQLSQAIIAKFGDMHHIAEATLSELCSIKGLGPAKALQLKAAVSLGLRAARKATPIKYRIDNPMQAYHLIRHELENEHKEIFLIILLDVKNFVISQQMVSLGTLSEIALQPREIFYPALRHHAASLILAHNHPSGDATPSKEDYTFTESLIKAGQMMGIPINDHLIIGNNSFTSMRQLGIKF